MGSGIPSFIDSVFFCFVFNTMFFPRGFFPVSPFPFFLCSSQWFEPRLLSIFFFQWVLDRCQWQRDIAKKRLNVKKSRFKIFCTARYENKSKSSKKKFQTLKKNQKKKILGRCWAKIGLRKTHPNVLFEAARFPVLDRHRSTKPTTTS